MTLAEPNSEHTVRSHKDRPAAELKAHLIDLIRVDGPLAMSHFMDICLNHPRLGYYATRPGIGRDFTTAPETSQIFGELIGLWCANEARHLGEKNLNWVEMGPGRGVLFEDALRAARQAAPDFVRVAQITLIETSPVLREAQNNRLGKARPRFETDLANVNPGPTILFANELLDCLTANRFVLQGGQWREQRLGLDGRGELCWGLSLPVPTPAEARRTRAGGLEIQPGLDSLVDALADRFKAFPGRALLIDYGPDSGPPSDSLRAYYKGEQIDPLALPGQSDLTVDVDFARLATLARARGLAVSGPIPQGQFLMALGAQARLNVLVKSDPEHAADHHARAIKLIEAAHMGMRFKVICLSSPELPSPEGF